ncbi:ChbG/HpnK family deacetylase [candidate division KSB1 bacterium]|nr:ChbG/HpnK family deacetylase [candidate division KSB1 bacterium]
MNIFLIVNADDLGRTSEINRGIVESFCNGIVTSASLLANFPAFDDAVQLIKRYDLPVGIHFNLTEGRPVSHFSRVSSLLNENGQFCGKLDFFRRLITGRLRRQEIQTELAAQLEKSLACGLRLDHYDGHHHIHAIKEIAPLVRSLGVKTAALPSRQVSRPRQKQSLVAQVQQYAIHLLTAKSPTSGPQTFWGFDLMGRQNKLIELHQILYHLQPGVNELMCHPGFVSQEDIGCYNAQRQQELDALCKCSVKRIINDKKIGLITYQELRPVVGNNE